MKRYALILMVAAALVLTGLAHPRAGWAADAASLDAALKDVAAYEFGKSRESLTVVSDAVRDSQGNAEARKKLVGELLAILKGKATLDGKQFACRQLSLIGNDECVPVLSGMLTAKETSDMARYALERIPGKAADKSLMDALGKASGLVKAGIINSLGARQCAGAVGALGKLAKDSDKMVAEAAIAALGRIADPAAAKALEAAKGANKELHNAWAEAYLLCADKHAQKDPEKAAKMYEQLTGAGEPDNIKVAAFRGRVLALGAAGAPAVVDALAGDNVKLQQAAAQLVRTLAVKDATPDKAVTQTLAAALPKLKPAVQALLVTALSDRGDSTALPAVVELSKSADESVFLAVIAATGKLGGAERVTPLAMTAASGKGPVQEAARASLGMLRGQDVDDAIVAEMKKAGPAVKGELAKSLAARNAVKAVPALIETGKDGDEGVRTQALAALGVLASEKDLPAVVDLLVGEPADGPRKEALAATVAVAKRIPDENKRAAALLAKLPSVKEATALGAIYTALGQIGHTNGLKPVAEAAKKGKKEVKGAAIRALAGWPTPAAIDDLVGLAGRAKDETYRVIMLRGILRLLDLPSDRAIDATLPYYEKALKIAKTTDEKKMVLGGLANVEGLSAMALVEPYLGVEDLKKEAGLAADKIRISSYKVTASDNPGDAKRAIDGNMDSRWTSGVDQKPDMSFTIDQGVEYEVGKITLDTTPDAQDYPRGYKVFVTNDESNWGNAVAEGTGSGPVTEISLTPKVCKYIKIVQTGTAKDNSWTIHELKVQAKSVAKAKKGK